MKKIIEKIIEKTRGVLGDGWVVMDDGLDLSEKGKMGHEQTFGIGIGTYFGVQYVIHSCEVD